MPDGGPDGGDGGRGGSVVVVADPQLTTLGAFRDRRSFKAGDGRAGAGSRKHGRDARDLELRVPPGTVVSDAASGEVLADLVARGARLEVAAGGRGGRGNARFATSVHQAPRIGELGAPGVRLRVHFELKLIADVGLVGLPNAGKSTLLAALTGAHPRIAAYPFTTLTPNLGVAELDRGVALVVADVPGLIEGASTGAGLGLDFLRHLERTRVLLQLVDCSDGASGASAAIATVRHELEAFSPALAAKPRLLVLTKMDLPGAEAAADEVSAEHPQAFRVAAQAGEGCAELLRAAGAMVLEARAAEPERPQPAGDAGTGTSAAPGGHRAYRHRPSGARAFSVSREGDAFRVSGQQLEREAGMTDMESDDAVARLQRRLRRIGVDEALAAAGCSQGDTVRIGALEFEYVDDARVGG